MDIKVENMKYIKQESLDNLVETYQKGMITHEALIDAIILNQKRLAISEICGSGVEGEILIRRMDNKGIKILI